VSDSLVTSSGERLRTVFRFDNVSKAYASTVAVRNLSLSLSSGAVLALMGENGAGKSTLLRILAGEEPPTQGEIQLDGQAVDFHSPADARRQGIRVVAQEPEIVKGLTVAENIWLGELPRRRRFVSRRRLRQLAIESLEESGFEGVLDVDRLGSELTPAQRQLVEIQRAIRPGLKVLALDEPTSSLTSVEVLRLFELIRRLRNEGVSVVYVSHRMDEVFQLADDIAVMRDGELQAVVDASSATEDDLIRLMVGRDLTNIYHRSPSEPGEVGLDVRDLHSVWHHGVSLNVRHGEVVGLAGLVGAGRTELAQVLFGELPFNSGSLEVDGVRLEPTGPRDAIRAGLGYTPEERRAEGIIPARSIRENISIARIDHFTTMGLVNQRRETQRTSELQQSLRIACRSIEQPVKSLSGGNQQKVVLARWLVEPPSVLILDEPTRGVDIGAKAELYSIIDELAARGVGILMISSELPELLGVADRVIVMRRGEITGELKRGEADESRILDLAMMHDEPSTRTAHGDEPDDSDR